MASLTDATATAVLDWLQGEVAAPTRPTGPVMCRLMTTNGSDSAAGTEVAGGSYAPQDTNLGAASAGAATNSTEIRFTDMPAVTVVGVELWDSAATPVRVWWGALAAQKTTNAGDDFVIPAGDLDVTLD